VSFLTFYYFYQTSEELRTDTKGNKLYTQGQVRILWFRRIEHLLWCIATVDR